MATAVVDERTGGGVSSWCLPLCEAFQLASQRPNLVRCRGARGVASDPEARRQGFLVRRAVAHFGSQDGEAAVGQHFARAVPDGRAGDPPGHKDGGAKLGANLARLVHQRHRLSQGPCVGGRGAARQDH